MNRMDQAIVGFSSLLAGVGVGFHFNSFHLGSATFFALLMFGAIGDAVVKAIKAEK